MKSENMSVQEDEATWCHNILYKVQIYEQIHEEVMEDL